MKMLSVTNATIASKWKRISSTSDAIGQIPRELLKCYAMGRNSDFFLPSCQLTYSDTPQPFWLKTLKLTLFAMTIKPARATKKGATRVKKAKVKKVQRARVKGANWRRVYRN